MFFYLYPHCIFIKGECAGAIYDFKEKKLTRLEGNEVTAVELSERSHEISADEKAFFEGLQENKLGFFREKKCFVEKLRPYNSYIFKRADLRQIRVRSVILKLNDYCNEKCDRCCEQDCPLCYAKGEEEYLQLTFCLEIIDELKKSGLEEVILTGGDVSQYEDLSTLVKEIKERDLKLKLVVHDDTTLTEDLMHGVELYVVNQKQQHLKVSQSVHGFSDLTEFDLESFFWRQDIQGCLFGRLYVDHKGNVIPCFNQKAKIVGNLYKGPLTDMIKILMKDYWFVQWRRGKCTKCELYYVCPTCRYSDIETCCIYNPEKGEFINEKVDSHSV